MLEQPFKCAFGVNSALKGSCAGCNRCVSHAEYNGKSSSGRVRARIHYVNLSLQERNARGIIYNLAVDTEKGYFRRLWSRGWRETLGIWTSYRWWLSIASPTASVLLLISRQGWRSVMNANDVLINAAGGAGVAFIGSLLISLFRAPKLLDADRATEIHGLRWQSASLSQELKTARALLAAPPKVSEWEQRQRKLVAEKLAMFSDDEKRVIQHIVHHGQVDRAALINAGIGETRMIDSAIQKGKDCLLLKEVGRPYHFAANQHFHLALSFYFTGD